MPRISPAKLALIGAQSTRWPTADSSREWGQLHSVIATAQRIVAEADRKIEVVTGDGDLSDVGRLKRVADIALASINELRSGSGLEAAERAVSAFLERAEKPGADAPSVAVSEELKVQIRASIAAHKSPLTFLQQHLADARVLAAVEEAPSFVSGLTDEHKNLFLERARLAIHPDEVHRRQLHESAVSVAHAAIAQAERMIAELGQLMKAPGGWQASTLARAA